MADYTALIDRILLLPYELRLYIYSFVYCIDYDSLKDLRDYLHYTVVHHIPPRAFLLKEPLYIDYRKQCNDSKSDDESLTRLRWPDHLEEAFLTVERIPTSFPTRRMQSFESSYDELLRETGSALTGIDRDIGECSRHLQLLKHYSAIAQGEIAALPLIEDIFRTRFIKRSALAGELCSTFHKMFFGRGMYVLERLHHAVSPAIFAATADIFFSIDNSNWDFVPWNRLHRGILPCLERIVIDLNFSIDTLRGGHDKSLWTTLEEHMQETIANQGAKQIILWLNHREKYTSSRNEPKTVQQFETMLALRKGWRGWNKYRRASFVLS